MGDLNLEKEEEEEDRRVVVCLVVVDAVTKIDRNCITKLISNRVSKASKLYADCNI